MRILVACEESQAVCKAFRELGHEAYSCDIMACSGGHPESTPIPRSCPRIPEAEGGDRNTAEELLETQRNQARPFQS